MLPAGACFGGAKPPQVMILRDMGTSTVPQLVPYLFGRIAKKASSLRAVDPTLKRLLGMPHRGIFFDDPRCLATMSIQRFLKRSVLADAWKATAGSDVFCKFPTQEVVEVPPRKTGKEISCEHCELRTAAELAECDFCGALVRTEKVIHFLAHD